MVNITPSTHNKGFTLVELAIALMVIGLLIGGILKGQELIENARITRTVKDIKNFETAVMIFRNTYNAIPGDMKNPGSRLPNCISEFCNYANSSYTGDSRISSINEIRGFWIHLERAGLIHGINEQEDRYSVSPKNSFDGYYVMGEDTVIRPAAASAEYPLFNRYRIGDSPVGGSSSDVLSCTRIMHIDMKMDDGRPLSGDVMTYINSHSSTRCRDEETAEYIDNNTSTRTYILIRSQSAK